MVKLSNHIVIEAPAAEVWEVIGPQFDRIGQWATVIPSSAPHATVATGIDAPVPGRVCHTGLRSVPSVSETIIDYDAAARTLTYQAGDLPAFIAVARNRWQVTAIGDHRSSVRFDAHLETRGLLGRLSRWWMLVSVNRTGRYLLDDLKYYLEHGKPSPRKQRQLDR